MPTIKIHNRTSMTLNLALSHLCPIHFKNSVKARDTWSVHVGSVWFTFECRPDTVYNRYSASKSAQTIGLITLTGASIALVAVPLAISTLAPIAGPSTVMAHLATNSVLAAGASSEVLAVTTWFATTLAKKTIYQLATERGVKEDELEDTLKTSATVIDSLKYASLSSSLVKVSASLEDHTKNPSRGPTKEHPIAGLMTGGLLDFGSKWLNRTFECQEMEMVITNEQIPDGFPESGEGWTIIERAANKSNIQIGAHTQVRGIFIGFGDEYEFEWREKLDEARKCIGVELWDLKLDLVLS
ncbi:hypothetical protein CROQUDRAFT_72470 [Cronartium quercuum f. sp. fusiforme G11]|uniref:Uncharacterized protein n=1 Tax=Cronartium quercuum f. sp. fusiforme G11 TaxID=708437 RepID=A0A9P6NSS4_9BASI|nr:hypothetical protein CROQUDRAFT_72470 [Cronartium quercuum f. sp. fusiforme G11]